MQCTGVFSQALGALAWPSSQVAKCLSAEIADQCAPAQAAISQPCCTCRDVPKRIDVLMFSAAAAAIMHCYSDDRGRHRDVFRSKYLNVLDFVFGNTGMPQAIWLPLLVSPVPS